MSETVFTYPGGKSQYADWIVSAMPTHSCYVEVFGGSGAVLLNKPTSQIEVFNDVDSDITHFFEVLRDHPDELVEYLKGAPFSKDLYDRWTKRYYQGWRPSDDIKRAAVFFFNRYAQWGGKYEGISGFARSASGRDKAETWAKKKRELVRFSERWEEVTIDNLDYRVLLDKYDADNEDGDGTLFYMDPPYMATEHRYTSSSEGFDHAELVEHILDLEGDWILSYGSELPDGLQDFRSEKIDATRGIDRANSDGKEAHERLVKSFPAHKERDFSIGKNTGNASERDW